MEALIFWAGLVAVGFFAGRWNESRHYRSIEAREREWLQLPVTSAKEPLGDADAIVRAELVSGSVVVSVDYFKRMLAALRGIVGGRVQSYETLLDRARREATLRLKESCRGADQIVNLRLETASISTGEGGGVGSVEVIAYATALYRAPQRAA